VVPYLAENEVFDVLRRTEMINDQGGQIKFLCRDMEILMREDINYMK
jgi:hypothetical protein